MRVFGGLSNPFLKHRIRWRVVLLCVTVVAVASSAFSDAAAPAKVPPLPITLLEIVVSGPGEVDEAAGGQYVCTAYYTDGTSPDVTAWTDWSESSSYASISRLGYLTTASICRDKRVVITARYGGRTAFFEVRISGVPPVITLEGIAIVGPAEIDECSGAQFQCIAYYSDGTAPDVSNWTDWEEWSWYAAVDDRGYVRTAPVCFDRRFVLSASFGGLNTWCLVRITGVPPQIALESLEIVGPTDIAERSGEQYACIAHYSDGTAPDVTTWADWSVSSDDAFISDVGYLRTAAFCRDRLLRLEATFGDRTAVLFIAVQAQPETLQLASIAIVGPSGINEQTGAQYTCTATYSDGSTRDVTYKTDWSESSRFAEITPTGYLTAGEVLWSRRAVVTARFEGMTDRLIVRIWNASDATGFGCYGPAIKLLGGEP